MSNFLGRLQAALAPTYTVEHEIAAGGMSVVFRAHDTALDRRVAIKVIRPELATAAIVERFTREARLLANLNHPRIVPVYSAGEADGLFYFVMPFIEGETLADRVKRGPLSTTEARRIGLDILDALATAHRIGVVHRDVTGRNVFLADGRALLADFGIASVAGHDQSTRGSAGTPGAMPPEQATGDEATPATDVYAVGALLYSALTGHAWAMTPQPDGDVWAHVPHRFARALRGALAWSPEDRYRDAAEFAQHWKRTRKRPAMLVLGPVAVLVITAVMLLFRQHASADVPEADLAILPFDVMGDTSSAIGRELARVVTLGLEGVPKLHLTPWQYALRWADAEKRGNRPLDYSQLHAKYHVTGAVIKQGNALDARISVFDRDDQLRTTISLKGSANSLAELSDSIALEILRRMHPRFASAFGSATTFLTRNLDALREFLLGEDNFSKGAWLPAEAHYHSAVVDDSIFLLAWWRLLNVRRWMPTVVPDPKLDLAPLFRLYSANVPELDRRLIEAQLIPPGKQRLAKLEEIVEQFPHDGYAALLFGDELLHRGPLSGEPLSHALTVLEQAAARDRFLAPAHEHLAWAAIRVGAQEKARVALVNLKSVASAPEDVDLYTPAFFEQAYSARFDPVNSAARLLAFLDVTTPDGLHATRAAVRAGLAVGLPETQRTMARLLMAAPSATIEDRANAYEALGLAELMQNRAVEGLAHLDTAAALFDSPEAHLQVAEWRALASSVGWPNLPPDQARAGRLMLERLAQQPATAMRASWALAIARMSDGNVQAARRDIARFRSTYLSDVAIRLATLLDAFHAGHAHAYTTALRISGRSLSNDAHHSHGDPFARALLHMKRAQWFAALGDQESAERELVWAENLDVVGWPSGPAQTAEVDWTFAVYALFRRAALARERGDVTAACARHHEAAFLLQGASFGLAANTNGCAT